MQEEKDLMSSQKLGEYDQVFWNFLSLFSEKKYSELLKELEKARDNSPEQKNIWHSIFQICSLNNDMDTQERIATQYAIKFGCMAPIYENSISTLKTSQSSGGLKLSIQTLTNEESEKFAKVFEDAISNKKPLLITFEVKKANQYLGVTSEQGIVRLNAGIDTLIKKKIPVYIEGYSCLEYLTLLTPEKRTEADWNLLFSLLTLSQKESVFEEVAVDYAISKGVSPPSWVPVSYPDKIKTFGNEEETSGKLKEQKVEGMGISFELVGSLSSCIDAMKEQLSSKNDSVFLLDMKKVGHCCWNSSISLLEYMILMEKTKKKILLIDPMPMVQEMFISLGIPNSSFFSQKHKK